MLARLQAFRFSPFLALTAALYVVGNVAPVSAQRTAQPSGRPVEATASSALAASTTIAPVSSAAFQDTNGNKVVAGAGAIHAVFTDASSVKYTKTVDGVNWSPPVTIEANANQPTITVAGTTIGVAYITSNNDLMYTYKSQTSSAWSSPVKLDTGAQDLSLVGYNSKMYLAWTTGSNWSSALYYENFPAVLNTAPAITNIEYVNPQPACMGFSFVYQPSIAVTPTSTTNAQPLIRIAYFWQTITAAGASCSSNSFGFIVQQRTSTWTQVHSAVFPSSGGPGNVSMSMTDDPSNGDFYIGMSSVYPNTGAANTYLLYENAWNPNDTWRTVILLARKAHVDVEAGCGKFRVAVSDFTQGAGGYGPTWYRTGTWTGQAATSPTWDEPTNVTVSNAGAHPQALFLSTHTGNIVHGTSHLISTAFDDLAGSSHSVRHDDRSFNGPSLLTGCLQTKSTSGTNAKAF